jgi:HAE1 family hydrophobic/amphiphilic exporter-1
VFGGVQASLTQPIYTFGKLSSIGRAAERAARATGLLEHKVAGDLAHQAAQAYYGVKLARELVWMLEDGMEQIEKAQKTLEERLADGSGDVTVQDRLRLETLVAEVRARLSEAREAEASALAGLRALVDDPAADVDDGLLEAVDYELAASPDGYVGRARDARPDLRAARLGADSVDALVAFEKSRYWPDLALIAGFNVTGASSVTDPPSAFANDPYNTIGAQLALVLRWKLDPASQPARVARAEAESHRAAALVEAAELGATFEVKRAHARAQQAKRRLEAVASGEKSAKGWVASVLQADAIGTASAKEMADAYVAYFTLRGRVLQSTYDWNVATVALRRAIGEFSASSGRP